MEGEISNFVFTWASVLVSACYCYALAKIVSKGTIRVVLILPVVFLFVALPLTLNSVLLGCPTAFFISWLANFKLLLFAFGTGPLSDPSLSVGRFIVIVCFPVKVQKNQSPKDPRNQSGQCTRPNGKEKPIKEKKSIGPPTIKSSDDGLKSTLYFAKKAMILACLVRSYTYKEYMNPNVLSFLICVYIYIGSEVMLGVVALIAQVLLGIQLEPPFNDPYLSTSFQDFWARRWNRMATGILRSAIYEPILHQLSPKVGHGLARAAALIGTFSVSALMHELLFFNLGRKRPTSGPALFFIMHGLLLVVERPLKKNFGATWKFSQLITGPLIFGFIILTFTWLVLPKLLDYHVDSRVFEEYAALGAYFKDLGMLWIERN